MNRIFDGVRAKHQSRERNRISRVKGKRQLSEQTQFRSWSLLAAGTGISRRRDDRVSEERRVKAFLKTFALVAAFACCGVHSAQADNGTWTSTSSGNWSDAGRWSGGTVADGSGSTADFSTINISDDRTITLDSSRTIGNLKFGDTSPSDDWTLASSGASTLTLEVSSGTPAIEIVNRTTTISLVLAGNQGFTKTGAGTLTLGGSLDNTYTGTATVSAGTLKLAMAAGKKPFGGELAIDGGTVSYSTIDNQIPDTANVTLSSGTLDFGARAETIGSAGSAEGSFTMNGGSVLKGSTGTVTLDRNPTITGGTITLSASSGAITANQELVFNGGTIDFTSASAGSSAALNLRGGTGTGMTYQSSGTSTALISNSGGGGARVSLNGSATTVFDIADSPTVGTEMSIGVVMTATGASIEKRGAGVLLLSAANGYTGTTTVSGGTLSISSDGNLGTAPGSATTGKLVLNGGALSATADVTLNANRGIALGPSSGSGGGTIDVATGATLTYNGIAANNPGGTGSLTKSGAGTLILGGANTYTGGTTLSGGSVVLGANNVFPNSGTVAFAGGTLKANDKADLLGPLSLTLNSTIQLGNQAGTGQDGTQQDLQFASFSASAGSTLTVTKWQGSAGTGAGGTDDRLLFLSNPSAFLGQIHFDGFTGALTTDRGSPGWEVYPSAVPEPATIFAGGFLLSVFGWAERKRLRSLFRKSAVR